ncbi:MAG: hypothetical protein ABR592_14070 [Nitriliruptorales bacterium]
MPRGVLEPGMDRNGRRWRHRDPSCIPPGFNLLQFFAIPAAFGCRPTVEGFVIWKNGPPPQDQAPMQQELFENEAEAVPVWFVPTAELEAATADGVLTIAELAALPSLVRGTATSFHETLHATGGAQQDMIQMNARGTVPDGRTFQLRGVCVTGDPRDGRLPEGARTDPVPLSQPARGVGLVRPPPRALRA